LPLLVSDHERNSRASPLRWSLLLLSLLSGVRLLMAKENACCGDSMALLPIQSSPVFSHPGKPQSAFPCCQLEPSHRFLPMPSDTKASLWYCKCQRTLVSADTRAESHIVLALNYLHRSSDDSSRTGLSVRGGSIEGPRVNGGVVPAPMARLQLPTSLSMWQLRDALSCRRFSAVPSDRERRRVHAGPASAGTRNGSYL
jgi:hypothetical protein